LKRQSLVPRTDWQKRIEAAGMNYHENSDGSSFWDESACYSFSLGEIEALENAVAELDAMCLQAVEHVIQRGRWDEWGIPVEYRRFIARSWETQERTIYGRFDLWFDGRDIKLLEFNADTPTSLLEASVVQWNWLEEVFPGGDQWNSIHERLIEAWQAVKLEIGDTRVVFTSLADGGEDFLTANYLRDTALQAGISTDYLPVEQIGWSARLGTFTDLREQPVEAMFKLYPWEWLWSDSFGQHVPLAPTRWFEAPWKAILSSKAILVALWDLFPDHPLLLRASFEPWSDSYAQKPIWGREGANTRLMRQGVELSSASGPYPGPFVFQELRELPRFSNSYPVCGAWLVNGYACGMGVREDQKLITSNTSRFVPHRISEGTE